MDFIDVSNNNTSEDSTVVYCPNTLCGSQMLFAQKGQFAGKYVCPQCGITVDPTLEYVKHENQLGSIISDENENSDDIIMVQPQERSSLKKNEHLDAIDLEIKAEIERGGRKQLVSISTQSNEAFKIGNKNMLNRLERPDK